MEGKKGAVEWQTNNLRVLATLSNSTNPLQVKMDNFLRPHISTFHSRLVFQAISFEISHDHHILGSTHLTLPWHSIILTPKCERAPCQ